MNIQIGVIGSMSDVHIDKKINLIAKELGREFARQKLTLLFSYEGDFESMSLLAAQEAEKLGGQTVAFIWNGENTLKNLSSLRIVTGSQRGGGREFPFVLSCDALIAIGGGSGTLMEIAMAYQAAIPIVVLKNTKGWSQKLSNTFLDERKRTKIIQAQTPKEAVHLALNAISKKNK